MLYLEYQIVLEIVVFVPIIISALFIAQIHKLTSQINITYCKQLGLFSIDYSEG